MSLVRTLIISTLLLPSLTIANSTSSKNSVGKMTRPSVEIDLDLTVSVFVREEGTHWEKGPDIKCGLNRGSSSAINNFFHVYNKEKTRRLIPGEMTMFTGVRPRPTYGANKQPAEYYVNTRPEPIIPEYAQDFRTLTLKNSVVAGTNDSHIVEINVMDNVIASRPRLDSGTCGKNVSTIRPEKDQTDGTIKISYQVPLEAQFVKIEVLEANDFLAREHIRGVEGAFNPNIQLVGKNYVWVDQKGIREKILNEKRTKYKADVEKKQALAKNNNTGSRAQAQTVAIEEPTFEPEDNRIYITLKYDAMSQGTPFVKNPRISNLKVKITPLLDPDRKLPYTDALTRLSYLLSEPHNNEESLLMKLGTVISGGDQLDAALRNYSLTDIQQIQDLLIRFALGATAQHKGFSPLTKAAASVLATQISEKLSARLLPICRLHERRLPILGETVELKKYVYLLFYMNRIIDRAKYFEPTHAYQIVSELNKLGEQGYTYLSVSKNAELMSRLSQSYDVFRIAFSELRYPLRTSKGEYQALIRDSNELINQNPQHQKILNLVDSAAKLEAEILIDLNQEKSRFIRNQPNIAVNVKALTRKVAQLDAQRLAIINELEKFTQDYMFSSLSVSAFEESLLTVFEGLGLMDSDGPLTHEVRSYYEPIFNSFFSRKRVNETSETIQLCLSGQLK